MQLQVESGWLYLEDCFLVLLQMFNYCVELWFVSHQVTERVEIELVIKRRVID